MVKKLIIFQFHDKKLLLPFGMALAQIILNIINSTGMESSKNQILELVMTTFSRLSLIFVPMFTKTLFNKKNEQKYLTGWKSKSALHFFMMGFIYAVYIGLFVIITYITTNYSAERKKQAESGSVQNPHNSGLSTVEGVELIAICVFSMLILKYKYFSNHILSIIVFIIVCFFMDYITENFLYVYDIGAVYITLTVFQKLADSISYVFQKYMMDILFHPFWSVGVTLGCVNFLYFVTMAIIALSLGKEKSIEIGDRLFIEFFEYFEKNPVHIIIIKHLLNYILNFTINLLRYLTIFYLTPEFILISFTISRIFNIVMKNKAYVCLALFVLQFISLLLYLEIIELNFCGLNKNTKRNIAERGLSEDSIMQRDSTTSSLIEFNNTYTLKEGELKEIEDIVQNEMNDLNISRTSENQSIN